MALVFACYGLCIQWNYAASVMGASQTWIDIGCDGFLCLLWASRPGQVMQCLSWPSVEFFLGLSTFPPVWIALSCPCRAVYWVGPDLLFVHGVSVIYVAAAQPLVQEFTFPPELSASMFVDPELRQLAQALPNILVRDRAASTVSTYLRAYKSWKAWAVRHSASFLPADSVTFTLYVVSLIQEARSMSAVNSAVYGVSYVHKKSGYPEVSEYPVVKQLLDAAKRILARPPTRKKPLSTDQVRSLLTRLEGGSVADLQLAALLALGFFGFLRWDDLHHLSVDSLNFGVSHVAIFLKKRKNDQFREGSWVFIARSSTPPCPVAVVEKFLRIGGHRNGSKLFRRVRSTKQGVCLRDQPMSYSRAKELLKKELKREGWDPSLFGIHSLRSGGASAAAALGVPDRLFQRHGGWRSEKARNNYVEESLDSLLLVSKSMLK